MSEADAGVFDPDQDSSNRGMVRPDTRLPKSLTGWSPMTPTAKPQAGPDESATQQIADDLVSVIIPAHNAEPWIATALRSVLAQNYRPLEILVVDDGSSDATADVARQALADFSGPWQVIVQENRGVSAARNVGCEAASGSWIQFLDSDDALQPGKITLQVNHARAASVPPDLVYSGWQRVTRDGDAWHPAEGAQMPSLDGKPPLLLLAGKHCLHPGCFIVQRSWIRRIGGFDETMSIWEDIDFVVRLAEAGAVMAHAPATTAQYLYRVFPDQTRWGGPGSRYSLQAVAMTWLHMLDRFGPRASLRESGLAQADQDELLDDCTMYLRLLYRQDIQAFRTFLTSVRRLAPGFVPRHPRLLHVLSHSIVQTPARSLI